MKLTADRSIHGSHIEGGEDVAADPVDVAARAALVTAGHGA